MKTIFFRFSMCALCVALYAQFSSSGEKIGAFGPARSAGKNSGRQSPRKFGVPTWGKPKPQTTGQDTVVHPATGEVMAPYEFEPPFVYAPAKESGILAGISPLEEESDLHGPFKAPEPEPAQAEPPREWTTAEPQMPRRLAYPDWTSGTIAVSETERARPLPTLVAHDHTSEPKPPPPTPECVEEYRIKLEERLLDRYNNLPQYAGSVGKVSVILSKPAEVSIDGQYIRASYDQIVYDSWGSRITELEKEYFSVTFAAGGVRHVRADPSIRIGLDAEKIYSESAPPVSDPFRNVDSVNISRRSETRMPEWWRPEFPDQE